MSFLQDISRLILNNGVDLYILVLWLRFLLQATGADFYNPLSQFTVQATGRLVDPLDRLFQRRHSGNVVNFRRQAVRWSYGSLLLIVLIKLLQIALVGVLMQGHPPSPLLTGFIALVNFPVPGDALLGLSGLLPLLINFYFFAIIAGVVLSWVAPQSPAGHLIFQIVEPLLAPCRRLLPATPGVDFSPMLVLLGLKIAEYALSRSVMDLARLLGL